MDDGQAIKLQPQNIEAEQSVLGAMIIDNDSISSIIEIINEEDFYRGDHREIFSAILSLFTVGENVDLVTLAEKLKTKGELDKVGGIDYLTNLATSVPTTANAGRYAGIVKDKALLRGLIQAAGDILEKGYEATDEAKNVLEYAEDTIFRILSGNQKGTFAPMNEIVLETVKKIEYAYHNKGKISGVPT